MVGAIVADVQMFLPDAWNRYADALNLSHLLDGSAQGKVCMH